MTTQKFDIVVFDLDSTLVKIEGLDWLANYVGKGKKVSKLTIDSMEGHMDFNTAMVKKMQLISPSRSDLVKLGETYCQNVVDGVDETVSTLHTLGKEVWILTGNFQPAVGILAKKLNIPSNRIICNTIFFTPAGEYVGFDINNPLSNNGGKAKRISAVANGDKKRVVYVGDSVTDLEVKGHIPLFVGFGGVIERKLVKEKSDIYINHPSLHSLLEIVLTKDELNTLKPYSLTIR